ncbi:MAG: hypothetical protein AB7J40_02415 [Candidatus Altimarinota bacterium]
MFKPRLPQITSLVLTFAVLLASSPLTVVNAQQRLRTVIIQKQGAPDSTIQAGDLELRVEKGLIYGGAPSGHFQAEVIPSKKTYVVGERVPVQVKVTRTDQERHTLANGEIESTTWVVAEANNLLNGVLTTNSSILTPARIDNAPFTHSIKNTRIFSSTYEFQCIQAGKARIDWKGDVTYLTATSKGTPWSKGLRETARYLASDLSDYTIESMQEYTEVDCVVTIDPNLEQDNYYSEANICRYVADYIDGLKNQNINPAGNVVFGNIANQLNYDQQSPEIQERIRECVCKNLTQEQQREAGCPGADSSPASGSSDTGGQDSTGTLVSEYNPEDNTVTVGEPQDDGNVPSTPIKPSEEAIAETINNLKKYGGERTKDLTDEEWRRLIEKYFELMYLTPFANPFVALDEAYSQIKPKNEPAPEVQDPAGSSGSLSGSDNESTDDSEESLCRFVRDHIINLQQTNQIGYITGKDIMDELKRRLDYDDKTSDVQKRIRDCVCKELPPEKRIAAGCDQPNDQSITSPVEEKPVSTGGSSTTSPSGSNAPESEDLTGSSGSLFGSNNKPTDDSEQSLCRFARDYINGLGIELGYYSGTAISDEVKKRLDYDEKSDEVKQRIQDCICKELPPEKRIAAGCDKPKDQSITSPVEEKPVSTGGSSTTSPEVASPAPNPTPSADECPMSEECLKWTRELQRLEEDRARLIKGGLSGTGCEPANEVDQNIAEGQSSGILFGSVTYKCPNSTATNRLSNKIEEIGKITNPFSKRISELKKLIRENCPCKKKVEAVTINMKDATKFSLDGSHTHVDFGTGISANTTFKPGEYLYSILPEYDQPLVIANTTGKSDSWSVGLNTWTIGVSATFNGAYNYSAYKYGEPVEIDGYMEETTEGPTLTLNVENGDDFDLRVNLKMDGDSFRIGSAVTWHSLDSLSMQLKYADEYQEGGYAEMKEVIEYESGLGEYFYIPGTDFALTFKDSKGEYVPQNGFEEYSEDDDSYVNPLGGDLSWLREGMSWDEITRRGTIMVTPDSSWRVGAGYDFGLPKINVGYTDPWDRAGRTIYGYPIDDLLKKGIDFGSSPNGTASVPGGSVGQTPYDGLKKEVQEGGGLCESIKPPPTESELMESCVNECLQQKMSVCKECDGEIVEESCKDYDEYSKQSYCVEQCKEKLKDDDSFEADLIELGDGECIL